MSELETTTEAEPATEAFTDGLSAEALDRMEDPTGSRLSAGLMHWSSFRSEEG